MEEALRKAYAKAKKTHEQAIVSWHAVKDLSDWVPVDDTETRQRLWQIEDLCHQAMERAWDAIRAIGIEMREQGLL